LKILITGSAGFIGYHLTKHLLNDPKNHIVAVDNLSRGSMDEDYKKLLDNERVSFIQLDLTDLKQLDRLGNNYNHVYHLAAVNGTKFFYEIPHEVLRVNMLSLINILEWMRIENKNGKFLFPSSNEAYSGGETFDKLPIPTKEEVPLVISNPYNPRWSYAATKLTGELFAIHYSQRYEFKCVIVRPHNFYGPRAGFDHVIPEFCMRIANLTDPFPIFGAKETRTFCFIEDAVKAMSLLMSSNKTDNLPCETFHIGGDIELPIEKLANILFDIVKWKPKNILIKNSPKGSVKRRKADISKIQKVIGWYPATPIDEGLKITYKWYSNYKEPKK